MSSKPKPNSPEEYGALTKLEKAAIQEWIKLAIQPANQYTDRSSYGIKHDFERVGFYISNGEFKGAMLAAGYTPKDEKALNWVFKVKATCPVKLLRKHHLYEREGFGLYHLDPVSRCPFDILIAKWLTIQGRTGIVQLGGDLITPSHMFFILGKSSQPADLSSFGNAMFHLIIEE